ncbi:hypothetical protein Tco_1505455 [Tanacetum coccineum]
MWAPRAGRQSLLPGGTPYAEWQTLQPGGWVVTGGIILLDISFNALARVVLGHGSSYFTISLLQLDLRNAPQQLLSCSEYVVYYTDIRFKCH